MKTNEFTPRKLSLSQKIQQRRCEFRYIWLAYKSFVPFVVIITLVITAIILFWVNYSSILMSNAGNY